jgi:molybdopterin synthase sulfur carrier subunit
MPTIWIPPLLQKFTNGANVVQIHGQSIREVIATLDLAFPGIKSHLCDSDDKIRVEIAVAVDSQIVTTGMRTEVSTDSEVHFLPALSGG